MQRIGRSGQTKKEIRKKGNGMKRDHLNILIGMINNSLS